MVLGASGHNNACLFVSLRVGLEVFTVLWRFRETGEKPTNALIDGNSSVTYTSAELLRQYMMNWFETGLDKELPGFGAYREAVRAADAAAANDAAANQGSSAAANDGNAAVPTTAALQSPDDGRNWMRGDVLALDMIRRGIDVPDADCPERTAVILQYIKGMRCRGVMGGTPEYVAFAFMSKLKIEVFQKARGGPSAASGGAASAAGPPPGYFIVNSVTPPEPRGTIRLLYNGVNHYDLLLSPEDARDIQAIWPATRGLRQL